MDYQPGPPEFDLNDLMSRFEVVASPLKRVIAIGEGHESSGVLVELIALELRERGAVLHWRTETADDQQLGPADITVSDDFGTRYEVLPANWSGGGRESRGETRIYPAPPDATRSLTIEVPSFGRLWIPPMAPLRTQVDGVWRFVITLD